MDNVDEPQHNSLEVEDRLESEEENALAAQIGKETSKDAEIVKVPFLSRLEERQKWDEDETISFLNLFKTLNRENERREMVGGGLAVRYWWCTTWKGGGKSKRNGKRERLRA
ncbi:hypothetical protein J1N35_000952 [Gossypium stocksii]|uniref:Uncharacterized protein n=1 Tax=Gossypium stocksii TaxID=47602 RepID=A0A9D4ALH9_9ROSI|nr:hypothetical protein J1N35_000952 [Gossypium stocksii]